MSTISGTYRPPDEAAIDELEKLLSVPLNSLFLKVLDVEHHSDLLTLIPWNNLCQVDVVILTAIKASGKVLTGVRQIE